MKQAILLSLVGGVFLGLAVACGDENGDGDSCTTTGDCTDGRICTGIKQCIAESTQSCASGVANCLINCAEGNCTQTCESGSDCTANCAGAYCRQTCVGNADCVLNCSGGFCTQDCGTLASCVTHCPGGGCD